MERLPFNQDLWKTLPSAYNDVSYVSYWKQYLHGASLKQTHHNFVVDFACEDQVFILGLHREGVCVEPLQKRQIQSSAGVAVLWCVDVCIHQSWHDKLAIKSNSQWFIK